MDAYEPMDHRRRDADAFLARLAKETEQLATLVTSLKAQLVRVGDTGRRERLQEQISARQKQLQSASDDLAKQRARIAEIFDDGDGA